MANKYKSRRSVRGSDGQNDTLSNNNYTIDLERIKFEFIKLALRNQITFPQCLVILRRTGLWEE